MDNCDYLKCAQTYNKVLCLLFLLSFLVGTDLVAQQASVTTDRVDYHTLEALSTPMVTNFPAKQYHAHPNNFDAVQDANGIMYFGNLWGVLQFDGTLWRKIYTTTRSSCTSLAIDSDGTIYVGGRNSIGYLKTDSIGRKYFVSLLDKIPQADKSFNEIWKTVCTPEGVLFASYEALFFKKRNEEKIITLHPNPWLVFNALGNTYVTAKEGLYIFKNGKIELAPNTETFNGKYINAITHIGDKFLVSTSEEGLFLYDGKKTTRWKTEINEKIRSYNPTKISNLDEKYLIITTELNGLIVTDLQGKILLQINKENGLAENTASGFYIDKDKNLWVTLYNGIALIPLFKQISYIGNYAGVSGIPYCSAVYNDKLYLATAEGLFWRALNNKEERFKRIKEINGLVWNLNVIDNKLFCGQAIAAYVIENDHVETLFNEGTWLFRLTKQKDRMLMGTYSGLHFLKKENGKWKYEKKIKGFYESSRFFAEDKFGDIWVSHGSKCVFKLRLDKEADSVAQIKVMAEESGLPAKYDNTVNNFNGDIIFTSYNGVFKFDYQSEKIIPLKKLNDLLKRNSYLAIKKIVQASTNTFWLIENNGVLIKVQIDGDEVKIQSSTELLKENLIADFEHLNPVSSEVSIVGTLEGFALYKEKTDTVANKDARALITKVETPKRSLLDGAYDKKEIDIRIPYDENSLKITFAVNTYQDLINNKFQFYLEGFDRDTSWSPSTHLLYKEYTNLSEGNYRFHLRALNFEGKLSRETVVEFSISPPWFRSWWAYLLYTISFIAVLSLVIMQVQKRFDREKKRIADEEQHNLWVKQREWEEANIKQEKTLMELQQEKLKIETAALQQKELMLEKEKEKEHEILKIEKEKFEASLHHKNNELTSLTLHITQKNEILTKIGNSLNKTINESQEESTLKNLKDIKTLIQKALNSDEWEKFSEHFNSVHEGFLKRLKQQYPDLSTSTLKLCAFIKMRLSSKQIATLMNTAPESVLKARYRLRTKFNLEKETGLEEFLNNF
jgi:ligand-binding sensor domain-containing protein